MRQYALVGSALLLASATSTAGAQMVRPAGEKLYFEACAAFQPQMTFDCYHSYGEVTAFLQEAVRRYPQYARLESIGESYQGRDLRVITVTDSSTGEPHTKPAMWVDAGIDADEVVVIVNQQMTYYNGKRRHSRLANRCPLKYLHQEGILPSCVRRK